MRDDFSLRNVDVKTPPMERFAQFLQRRGKRITQQRRLIVHQVFSHHDHFDADELMDHLQGMIAQRKVSRPTVYRTLAELVEAGLLRKMSLGGRSVEATDASSLRRIGDDNLPTGGFIQRPTGFCWPSSHPRRL